MDSARRSLQGSARERALIAALETEGTNEEGVGAEGASKDLGREAEEKSASGDAKASRRLRPAHKAQVAAADAQDEMTPRKSASGARDANGTTQIAGGGQDAQDAESPEDVAPHDERGDVTFGDLRWYVVDEKEGLMLLMSVDVVDIRAFNDEMMATTWLESDLLAYLNTYFLKHHIPHDQLRFIEAKNYINTHFVDTTSHVFVPSIQEMRRLFKVGEYDPRRIACIDGEPVVWWLRTMQGPQRKHAGIVTEEGTVLIEGQRWENGGAPEPAKGNLAQLYRLIDLAGVRPCMWVRREAFETQQEPEANAGDEVSCAEQLGNATHAPLLAQASEER